MYTKKIYKNKETCCRCCCACLTLLENKENKKYVILKPDYVCFAWFVVSNSGDHGICCLILILILNYSSK